MWVVEMRGFMPNVDGRGEEEPSGRIVILEDNDRDGRFETSSVFLEGLVLPRAVLPVLDGALIAAPPELWYCAERKGRCVKKTLVAGDYGARGNPEHTANGLLYGLDNWIYSANWPYRLRYRHGKWEREGTLFRGQWGLTQDDQGRLFYNTNEDQLRGDLFPAAAAQSLARNPHYRGAEGLNVQIAKDQSCWPIRPTPGVNRGYRKNQIRDDGTLATFTAACGPAVYRGHVFPPGARGNVFLAEPAGNIVRRAVLTEDERGISARNYYEKMEFLASSDERFRPVNCYSGPDGALYVLDMARGVIQHRIFVTTYLRLQILERGLEQPLNQGRIYRVLPANARAEPPPKLAIMTGTELVAQLAHPNGWVRDTAQRLLVERSDPRTAPLLRRAATSAPAPWTRLHALWALEGTQQLDAKTALAALGDAEPTVRAAAIRVSEGLLATSATPALRAALLKLLDDPSPRVRAQLAFTLGEIRDEAAEGALAALLAGRRGSAAIRDAVISGLGGRELEFLPRLAASDQEALARLAACVVSEGNPQRVARLLELAARHADLNTRQALLNGVESALPKIEKNKPLPRPVAVGAEPGSLLALAATDPRAAALVERLTWPGKRDGATAAVVTPLTAQQQKLFERGSALFRATCAQCHLEDGRGLEGKGTPLRDSEWVLGSEQRLIRIVLNGLKGQITVQGVAYNMEMPAFGEAFSDEEIAAILTYLRREWGHAADAVAPATVAAVRAALGGREEPWTEAELLGIK